MHEEGEGEDPAEAEDPDEVARLPSTSKVGTGNGVVRIGPPRRRKKITRLPPTATLPSPHTSSSAFSHLREEEEENTQEAAGVVLHPDSSPPTIKKKKRRLKPASDVRPKLPVLAENEPLVLRSRDAGQEPREPSVQEEPFEADPPPPDRDEEPIEPLPEPVPSRSVRQQTPPDSSVGDDISVPAPLPAEKTTKRLGPVPRLESSHFKPYLRAADTTSVIDEFSPKKTFPTQDTIESSVEDSQVRRTATESRQPSLDPEAVDIPQKMQDAQDACFDFDDQATEHEVPDQEQSTTVSNIG